MSDRTSPPATGFLDSFRTLGDGLLAGVQNRLELFSAELHEEKFRLMQVFLWITAAALTAVLAVTFASLALVYLFWETARLAVLAGLGGLYAGIFGLVLLGFRRYLARQPRPFAATLEELERDRACFRSES